MNLPSAIGLGLLQGATEFLPISSSGHLVLAQILLGIDEAGLAFDVSLHLGTLLAILIYFRTDFLKMFAALLSFRHPDAETRAMRSMAMLICLATIPAVLAALLFGKAVETFLRSPLVVAITLIIGGILLLWAERYGRRLRDFQSIGLSDSLIIGAAQAFALIPGLSRSGITMTAGLFRGLNRQTAARFSFLMSAPVIFGAGVHEIPKIIKIGLEPAQMLFFLAGFLSAALSGCLFIAVLINYIKTRTFDIFAYYRFGLAGVILLAMAIT